MNLRVNQKMKIIPKKYYIDNEKFYEEMVKFLQLCNQAKLEEKERPTPSNYIGECFIKIAEKFVNHRYFVGYSYRDELIGDAIENCMKAIENFNPELSKNPFAYFSQITYFAFRRRCIAEMNEQNKKYKMLEDYDIDTLVSEHGDDDDLITYITESARKQVDTNQKTSYNTTPKPEKKEKLTSYKLF